LIGARRPSTGTDGARGVRPGRLLRRRCGARPADRWNGRESGRHARRHRLLRVAQHGFSLVRRIVADAASTWERLCRLVRRFSALRRRRNRDRATGPRRGAADADADLFAGDPAAAASTQRRGRDLRACPHHRRRTSGNVPRICPTAGCSCPSATWPMPSVMRLDRGVGRTFGGGIALDLQWRPGDGLRRAGGGGEDGDLEPEEDGLAAGRLVRW